MKKLILIVLAIFISTCAPHPPTEIEKDQAQVYLNQGIYWAKEGDLGKAIADYTKAIELNPKYVMAYNNRGIAYGQDRGQYDKAISDFNKAIEINPSFAEAYNNRGIAYYRKGQVDKAIADYTKATKINPRYAEAYANRGIAYRRKGKYDKAISDYSKAIELNPRFAKAYYNRGLAYAQDKGEYDQAISDNTKAIELNPRYVMAYNNRGISYRRSGEYQRAIEDYNQAIHLDPNHALAYINLSWLLATCPDSRYRNGTKALSLAQKALELNKKLKRNSACMDTLAAAYAEAGNFEEAIKTQERAINLLKNSVDTKELADKKEHLESYKAHKPWREPKASGGNP